MIKKNKWMILVITLLCLAETITLWRLRSYQEQEVFLMDSLLNTNAEWAHYLGSLQEATNATISFIDFMQTHKKELEMKCYQPIEIGLFDKNGIQTGSIIKEILVPYDIDVDIFLARKKLGYMFLCAGDVESACRELSLVWDNNNRNEKYTKIPRTEYLAHLTNGMEWLYSVNVRPKWEKEYPLKEDVIEKFNDLFMSKNNLNE